MTDLLMDSDRPNWTINCIQGIRDGSPRAVKTVHFPYVEFFLAELHIHAILWAGG